MVPQLPAFLRPNYINYWYNTFNDTDDNVIINCTSFNINEMFKVYNVFDYINRDLDIIFDFSAESGTWDTYRNIHKSMEKYPGVVKQVTYATSGLNVHSEYDEFCKVHNITDRMHVVQSFFWENIHLFYKDISDSNFKPTEFTNRPKKYINLNRRLWPHRPAFVSLLSHFDLLKYGHVSLFETIGSAFFSNPNTYVDCVFYDDLKSEIDDGFSKLSIPMTVDKPDGLINYARDNNSRNVHLEAYFSLVSCTYIHHDRPLIHMTEKNFKPIAYKQPFILISEPHTLSFMQDYGFKTFSEWFDESYDAIEDHALRMMAITREVERLCRLSNNEWDNIIHEMEGVLEHNFNRLLNSMESFKYSNLKGIDINKEFITNDKTKINCI